MEAKANHLMEWLKSKNFEPVLDLQPDKNYFPEPLIIDKKHIFIRIKPSKPLATETKDIDHVQVFKNLKELMLLEANIEILSIIESLITSVDIALASKHIHQFALRLLDLVNINLINGFHHSYKPPISMQILVNNQQSLLDIIESTWLTNLGIANQFEFIIPINCSAIYIGLWFIRSLAKQANLNEISLTVHNETIIHERYQPPLQFTPTLAVLLDDCDVYSTVDRILDLIAWLPVPNRKVDVWIQQSIKKKFTDKFTRKASKRITFNGLISKKLIEIVDTDAINPVLKPYDDPDLTLVKLLTFRKLDELTSFLKRYFTIKELNLWTNNVSSSIEIVNGIHNCPLFTINTINDTVLSGYRSLVNHSNQFYMLHKDSTCIFQNPLPFKSFITLLSEFDVTKTVKGRKELTLLSKEELFSAVCSTLKSVKCKSCDNKAISMIQLTQLQRSTFKYVNKYIMLKELLPIGTVFIKIAAANFEGNPNDIDNLFGYIGASLVLANCCVVITEDDLAEELNDSLNQFKQTFPSSFFQFKSSSTIPLGWLFAENWEVVGICVDFPFLSNLGSAFPLLMSSPRSIFFPVADQLSIATSSSSGY